MATIAGVFNKCFGEMLKPYGYKKIKGNNCFVKPVNNEVFLLISFQNLSSGIIGYKEFTVYAGAFSIYIDSINPKFFRTDNPITILTYAQKNGANVKGLNSLVYNEETLQEVVAFAADKTEEIILPVLERVVDLASYIEYRKLYYIGPLMFADRFFKDSLALIKANNHDDFEDVFKKSLHDIINTNPEAYAEKSSYDRLYNGLRETIIDNIAHSRDKVYNDSELYQGALEEMDRRRQVNTETLKSYGLDL